MGYKTAPSRVWSTSVNEIVHIFRDSLLAFVPIAERARMPWREPKNYDDWDSIAQSLFQSIVVASLAHSKSLHTLHKLPKYDVRIGDYSEHSFLRVASTDKAFVSFGTDELPFDLAVFAYLDGDGKVLEFKSERVDNLYFVLANRSSKSQILMQDKIDVEL